MQNRVYAQIAASLLAFSLLVACTDDGGNDAASGTSTSITSTTVPIRGPVVEWGSIKPTELGDGWRVQDCDGDAPFVCVARNNEIVGVMEVLRLPTEGRTLDQHVAGYYESIKSDRKDGCGADYKIATEPVRPVAAPGGAVVRYGFTGALGNAPGISERVIQFAGIRDDKLVILAAGANDDGGCLSREGEFTTAQLREFEPRLALLISSSGLP